MSRPICMLMAALLVLPGVAGADEGGELTPEKVAHIRRDEAAAMKKVDDEFGNRKPSEMSNEERGQAIQKQSAATTEVLEKHGVTAKEYDRFTAKMGREGNERAKAEGQRLEEKAKASKQAAAKPAEEKEVSIQNGFDNDNPVELESNEGDNPEVQIGIPVEGEEGGEEGGAVGAQAATGEGQVPVEIIGGGDDAPAKKAVRRPSSQKTTKVKKKARKKTSDDE